MRNGADARSWPQDTLCIFRFASNSPIFLESERLWETARATVLLIKIGDFSEKAKTCPKHSAQLSCSLKLASKHTAQPPFCFKLARIVRKPRLVKKAVNNFRFAQKLAPNHTAQLSFCLKWATFNTKLKLVQNTVRKPAVAQNWPDVGLRNCRFAWNWPVLLGS